jgi:large subunit ribosomal protein L21
MRYAIVASGGKQYVAREGETLEVDRLDKPAGQSIEFPEVLLAADGENVFVGAPNIAGARVQGTIEGEVRGEKIVVFRYQPKKRRRRRLGHRQTSSRVKIECIDLPGLARAERAAPEKKAPARKAAAAAKKAPEGKKAAPAKKSSAPAPRKAGAGAARTKKKG